MGASYFRCQSWQTATRTLVPLAGYGLIGILNLTPDSFFDGGRFVSVENALSQARKLVACGADVLDLGAESSRPGSRPVEEEEELARLLPVLVAIRRELPGATLSVDTWRSRVAAVAIEHGAQIINDIGACQRDPGLADVLSQFRPAYILMHARGLPINMQQKPHYANVVDEVKEFFSRRLEALVARGVPETAIALDPGIGFGKTLQHNLELLARLPRFMDFGRPLVVGLSMKSMFGDLLGEPVGQRGTSTAVASVVAWQKGALWHRVHDVCAVRKALVLAGALCK